MVSDRPPSSEDLCLAAESLSKALGEQGWWVGYAAVVPDDGQVLVRVLESMPDLEAELSRLSTVPVRVEVIDDDHRAVIGRSVLQAKGTTRRTYVGLEGIRRSPKMYFGEVWAHTMPLAMMAMTTACLLAQDEGTAPDTVQVTVHTDGSFTVVDDGPGLSVEPHPRHGRPLAEAAMTLFPSPPALPGAGLALVTAMSERAQLTVWRAGVVHQQLYDGDEPATALQAIGPTERHGTAVRFYPSATAIGMSAVVPLDWQDRLPRMASAYLRQPSPVGVRMLDERTAPEKLDRFD